MNWEQLVWMLQGILVVAVVQLLGIAAWALWMDYRQRWEWNQRSVSDKYGIRVGRYLTEYRCVCCDEQLNWREKCTAEGVVLTAAIRR